MECTAVTWPLWTTVNLRRPSQLPGLATHLGREGEVQLTNVFWSENEATVKASDNGWFLVVVHGQEGCTQQTARLAVSNRDHHLFGLERRK